MQIGVFDDEEVNTIQAEGGEKESLKSFVTLVVWYQNTAVVTKKIKIRLRRMPLLEDSQIFGKVKVEGKNQVVRVSCVSNPEIWK